jgi:hypothetical protein
VVAAHRPPGVASWRLCCTTQSVLRVPPSSTRADGFHAAGSYLGNLQQANDIFDAPHTIREAACMLHHTQQYGPKRERIVDRCPQSPQQHANLGKLARCHPNRGRGHAARSGGWSRCLGGRARGVHTNRESCGLAPASSHGVGVEADLKDFPEPGEVLKEIGLLDEIS